MASQQERFDPGFGSSCSLCLSGFLLGALVSSHSHKNMQPGKSETLNCPIAPCTLACINNSNSKNRQMCAHRGA